MAIKYSQKVIKEFTEPANVGELEDANAEATEGSAACGDMITYQLSINPTSRVIEDIRFRSYGCASNIATASVATKIAKGKKIDEIKSLTPKAVTEELEGLPAVKIHCSVLAINGLKSAIRSWEIEEGLIEPPPEGKKADRDAVIDALRNVINPETGVDLVKMNMVRDIVFEENGGLYVELLMGETEVMFYESIEEEAREHLEELDGIRSVTVKLSDKTALKGGR